MASKIDWLALERTIMNRLGFKPTPRSGAGDIKEDGQNDFAIAQLKCTSGEGIRVSHADIRRLEKNAYDARKIPVFVLHWVEGGTTYICMPPEYLGAYVTSQPPSQALYAPEEHTPPSVAESTTHYTERDENNFIKKEKHVWKNKKRFR